MRIVQITISAACCALMLGACAAEAYAQESATVGVKVGFNVATIALSPPEPGAIASKVGLVGGLSLRFPVGENVFLQPEALFSMKGNTEPGDTDSLTIQYLEIPILATFRIPTTGSIAPFVSAGPALGLKLNASFNDNNRQEDGDAFVKGSDFGIVFAGGIEIGRFGVEGRYTFGLANINNDFDRDELTAKNRAFAILFGATF